MRRRTLLAGSAAALVSASPIGGVAAAPLRMPRAFTWGVSTSAFQIEGSLDADGRGASVWDPIARADAADYVTAADHYRHWRRDVTLLSELGIGAYRFSVSWSRIFPDGAGRVNHAGLDFYDRLVDGLMHAGIAPYLCLYHWDLPAALQQRGGWLDRGIVDAFAEYATVVAARLGDRVRHWIAVNEALSIAYGGYAIGYFPPYAKSEDAYFAAAHHLNLAQGAAFTALAARGRRLGTAMCLHPIRPLTDAAGDVDAARSYAAMTTRLFLDPLLRGRYPAEVEARVAPGMRAGDLDLIRYPVDFVGVNYYGPEYRRAEPGVPAGAQVKPTRLPAMANGILIDAGGLYAQLRELRDEYGNPPVLVTENGVALRDQPDQALVVRDDERIAFIHDHLRAIERARADGADVRGYFVWSLADNFEWRQGYGVRFGLVYVDLATGRRIPKSSFRWYGAVARSCVA